MYFKVNTYLYWQGCEEDNAPNSKGPLTFYSRFQDKENFSRSPRTRQIDPPLAKFVIASVTDGPISKKWGSSYPLL